MGGDNFCCSDTNVKKENKEHGPAEICQHVSLLQTASSFTSRPCAPTRPELFAECQELKA